jgi:small subunit ribosomal protein S6e
VFKIVVSDPKTRRTYQKEVGEKESGLMGRKIGDKVKGDFLGLHGYEFQVTGGSDKQGFPMRQDIPGAARKKMLLTGGPGFHPTEGGERRRKIVRGNTVSEEIAQVNMKAVVHGKDSLAKLFGKEEKEEKKEAKAEHKHEEKKEEHKTEAHEHKPEHAEAKHDKPAEHKAEHKAEAHEHKPEHTETKEHKKE